MRAVNLMPRDERRTRLEIGRLPLLGALGGVIVVTAGAFLLASSASGTADDLKAEVQALEVAIDRVPEAPGSAGSSGAIVQERSDRVAALSAALASRTAYDRVLREISLVLPADVWLIALDASTGAAATPAGAAPTEAVPTATGVTISGAAFTHDAVAKALGRLSLVPSLTGVRLTGTVLVDPQSSDSEPGRASAKPFIAFVVSAGMTKGQS